MKLIILVFFIVFNVRSILPCNDDLDFGLAEGVNAVTHYDAEAMIWITLSKNGGAKHIISEILNNISEESADKIREIREGNVVILPFRRSGNADMFSSDLCKESFVACARIANNFFSKFVSIGEEITIDMSDLSLQVLPRHNVLFAEGDFSSVTGVARLPGCVYCFPEELREKDFKKYCKDFLYLEVIYTALERFFEGLSRACIAYENAVVIEKHSALDFSELLEKQKDIFLQKIASARIFREKFLNAICRFYSLLKKDDCDSATMVLADPFINHKNVFLALTATFPIEQILDFNFMEGELRKYSEEQNLTSDGFSEMISEAFRWCSIQQCSYEVLSALIKVYEDSVKVRQQVVPKISKKEREKQHAEAVREMTDSLLQLQEADERKRTLRVIKAQMNDLLRQEISERDKIRTFDGDFWKKVLIDFKKDKELALKKQKMRIDALKNDLKQKRKSIISGQALDFNGLVKSEEGSWQGIILQFEDIKQSLAADLLCNDSVATHPAQFDLQPPLPIGETKKVVYRHNPYGGPIRVRCN